jgi:hypothetical protein
MRADIVEAFREAKYYLICLRSFFLSHHPDCKDFDSDVIRFGTLRLCRGCTIGYGLALVLFLLFILIPSINDLFRQRDTLVLGLLGVILAGTQLLRVLVQINSRAFKTLQKAAFGTGLFLLASSLILYDAPLATKIIILLISLVIVGGILSLARPYYILKTCKECSWHQNWDDCPGFDQMACRDRVVQRARKGPELPGKQHHRK